MIKSAVAAVDAPATTDSVSGNSERNREELRSDKHQFAIG
jgi:hypothetical protein